MHKEDDSTVTTKTIQATGMPITDEVLRPERSHWMDAKETMFSEATTIGTMTTSMLSKRPTMCPQGVTIGPLSGQHLCRRPVYGRERIGLAYHNATLMSNVAF